MEAEQKVRQHESKQLAHSALKKKNLYCTLVGLVRTVRKTDSPTGTEGKSKKDGSVCP